MYGRMKNILCNSLEFPHGGSVGAFLPWAANTDSKSAVQVPLVAKTNPGPPVSTGSVYLPPLG